MLQFHGNGFRTGDLDDFPVSPSGERRLGSDAPPSHVDILIVGSGPAGLTLAGQMAAFPAIETCIIEQAAGPPELGRADGIACRSLEMFNAFGFAEQVLRESYRVNETRFWQTHDDPEKGIYRSGRV